MSVLKFLSPYKKAIAGGLAAGLTALIAVMDEGVTAQEWGGILIAVVGGTGLVYIAPKNKPAPVADERGDAYVYAMLTVIAVGVALLLFRVRF